MPDEPSQLGGPFPSTSWQLLRLIGQEDDASGHQKLDELLGRYWPALRAHLLHRRQVQPENVEDVLQEFATTKIMEQDIISLADPSKGKFRTFLLTVLDRFVLNYLRRERPHDAMHLAEGADPVVSDDPSDVFDVEWARQVISMAMEQMHQECVEKERLDLWGMFQARIIGPMLHGTEPLPYEELVQQFDLASPASASNALITAKRMFIRRLQAVVGEYAQSEDEISEEIRDLHEIVSRAGAGYG